MGTSQRCWVAYERECINGQPFHHVVVVWSNSSSRPRSRATRLHSDFCCIIVVDVCYLLHGAVAWLEAWSITWRLPAGHLHCLFEQLLNLNTATLLQSLYNDLQYCAAVSIVHCSWDQDEYLQVEKHPPEGCWVQDFLRYGSVGVIVC